MESNKIYEESKNEIARINKFMGSDSLTINVSKLDAVTKEQLLTAIANVLAQRSKDIDKIILGCF